MERNSRGQKESVRSQEKIGVPKVKEEARGEEEAGREKEASREKEAGLQEEACEEGDQGGKAFRQENAREENTGQEIAGDGRWPAAFEKPCRRSPTASAAAAT